MKHSFVFQNNLMKTDNDKLLITALIQELAQALTEIFANLKQPLIS